MNQTKAASLSSLIGETRGERDILRQLEADPACCSQYQKLTPELQEDLQEFLYIPLDIFLENRHTIHTETDAWLSFLSMDDPKVILEIITKFPAFIPLYNDIFQFRRDIREVLNMFSKELEEMDRNTIRYMVEQQQDLIEKQKAELAEKENALAAKDAEKEAVLAAKNMEITAKDAEIEQLCKQLTAQK